MAAIGSLAFTAILVASTLLLVAVFGYVAYAVLEESGVFAG